MSGRSSYTKVGSFPSSYRFIRLGDTCIFKATNPHKGWKPNAEVNGIILRVHITGENPHILIQIDPTRHSLLSTIFCIYPKGHPEFDFFLKLKGTGLGCKLNRRAKEEREAAYQGDLFPKFMA